MRGGRDRGQTNIDFIIAIAVFLIAFTFVLGFMPRLFAPYADEEKPIVAGRVESALVESVLVTPGDEPGVLDTNRTDDFFSSPNPRDKVGIGVEYQLNVTLRENATGPMIKSIGPPSPQNRRSVGAARRSVLYEDQPAIVEVKVW